MTNALHSICARKSLSCIGLGGAAEKKMFRPRTALPGDDLCARDGDQLNFRGLP